MTHPPINKLVVATHNQGKLREFAELLGGYVPHIVSAGSLNLPEPVEDGDSFTANALIKARVAAQATGMVALSDDSGLCVAALNGDPGIYSARWAGPGKDFAAAMRRIQDGLADKPDRSAHFICVLALCWPNGDVETIEGRIDGMIAPTPRGSHGHGYDPIFIPNGFETTFAEMGEARKNAISHRGQATRKLVERFFAGAMPAQAAKPAF